MRKTDRQDRRDDRRMTKMEAELFDMIFGGIEFLRANVHEAQLDFSLALRSANEAQLDKMSEAFPGGFLKVEDLKRAVRDGYTDEEAVQRATRFSSKIMWEKRKCAYHIVRLIADDVMAMEEYYQKCARLAEHAKEEGRKARLRAQGKLTPLEEVISEEEKSKLKLVKDVEETKEATAE